MNYPLYDHQKRIISEDKKKCGIFTGTGSGKTLTTLLLAKGNTLVICPKQQREDRTWQKNAEKFEIDIKLTVISKEDLRRDWKTLSRFDTVILEECHTLLGVQPITRQRKGIQIPKSSQVFEAVRDYLNKFPPERLYMCSATPIPKPMSMWAIATLFGTRWNFFDFRNKYYTEIRMGMRRIWLPRKKEYIKDKLAELVKCFGYTGTLNDFFDVPEQVHKTVYIDLTDEQKRALKDLSTTEADPMVRRSRARTIENGVLYGKKIESISDKEDVMVRDIKVFPSNKIDYILERAMEFPKMLIFANYTAQINEIAKALKEEGYNVVTLTGQTKDRVNLISDADASESCIVVAQASMSSGYELPSFPCCIFASKDYRYVSYAQGCGRILRANSLKKNLYIHLVIKNGVDEKCHKTIMEGQDFQEKLTLNV